MTVDKIRRGAEGQEVVWCVWFEGKKKELAAFSPETLEADDGVPHIA